MQHFTVVFAILCTITGAIALYKLLRLESLFKTSYLKFFILSMAFIYANALLKLVFYYQLVNIGSAESYVRLIFSVSGTSVMYIAILSRVLALYKLINLRKSVLILVFVAGIVIVWSSNLYYNYVWSFFREQINDFSRVFYQVALYLFIILAQIGLLNGVESYKKKDQVTIVWIVSVFIAIDLYHMFYVFFDFILDIPHPFYGIHIFVGAIILNLITIFFARSVVLQLNDMKILEKKFIDFDKKFSAEYQITEREKEIISLIMKGYSNAEISSALKISIHTVKDHVKNIFQKTGVNNRVELANLDR